MPSRLCPARRQSPGRSAPPPPSLPEFDPYAGDASSGAPSDDDEYAFEDAALDAAVLAAVLPRVTPPDRDARWQDLCTRAKVDYVPPGADRRDHLMQQRVDRCGVTRHR